MHVSTSKARDTISTDRRSGDPVCTLLLQSYTTFFYQLSSLFQDKINYPDLWGTNIEQVYYSWGSEHGGLQTFPTNTGSDTTSILARVGVSFISIDQACANAEEEIPDWDFQRVVDDSQTQWRDVLSRVQVETENVDTETTVLLYSSVGGVFFLRFWCPCLKCFASFIGLTSHL